MLLVFNVMKKANLTKFPLMGHYQWTDRSKSMNLCLRFSSLNSHKSEWSEITLSNYKRECDFSLNYSNISYKPTVQPDVSHEYSLLC